MSQEKVDRNKDLKANKKKIVAREKKKHIATVICSWAVVIVLAGWLGYSAYSAYENSKPIETIYANLDAINEYSNNLNSVE